jgi:predicted Zn-dependent peptidase
MPERTDIPMPRTKVILHPETYPPMRITESLDISQGKISIGFRLGKFMENTPDFPALFVFNSLYGGCATSKLFLNVREKLSLCYYASTLVDREKGILIVTSGVDFSNFDTALEEILAQLDMIKEGKIEDWELLSAKRAVTTSLKAAMDRPGGLEGLYFNNLISLFRYDPEELCDLVEAVTLERVVEASSDINADTIHMLTQN